MTGMILHESNNIVIIITFKSGNIKTGDMAQIWIMRSDIDPVEAIKQNIDDIICFECIHRLNRTCYINPGQAPLKVYEAYKKGLYEPLDLDRLAHELRYKTVRFGAYGEPVLIPLDIVKHIIKNSMSYTGYTQQWNNPKYKEYRTIFMASIESDKQLKQTKKLGIRSYRVTNNENDIKSNEIICPNVTKGITCNLCTLCDNQGKHKNAKSIVVPVHGTKGKINSFNLLNL